MTGRTHLLAGMCIGTLYASAYLPSDAMIPTVAAAAIGSLVPDIDRCTSTLGRKLFPAALVIQVIFKHRTVFHSPILYGFLWWILTTMFPAYTTVFTAALIGIASHLFLDMMNPQGIPLFYPIPKKIHIAAFRSGGTVDRMLQPILAVALIALLMHLL